MTLVTTEDRGAVRVITYANPPFGPVSLLLMLDTLGLRLLVVEDPYLTARTLKRRTPRVRTHIRCPRELPGPVASEPDQ